MLASRVTAALHVQGPPSPLRMVVAAMLDWILAQLRAGRQARMRFASHPDRLLLQIVLLPKMDDKTQNSVLIDLIYSVTGSLPWTVSVDHGHKNSRGEAHISLQLRAVVAHAAAPAEPDGPGGGYDDDGPDGHPGGRARRRTRDPWHGTGTDPWSSAAPGPAGGGGAQGSWDGAKRPRRKAYRDHAPAGLPAVPLFPFSADAKVFVPTCEFQLAQMPMPTQTEMEKAVLDALHPGGGQPSVLEAPLE